METVVIVAIAILAAIFAAALLTMMVLCRHNYCRHKSGWMSNQLSETRPEVHLISSQSMDQSIEGADLELNEVDINIPCLDGLFEDERWISDAKGLIPHCLNILKTCHQLAERMVAMTMSNSRNIRTQERLTDIVTIVKRIGPRVDDVVQSMYPPLDPRLLEARCTALVLSVSHLVMITKHVCGLSGQLDWIDQSLADIDESLTFLKESSVIGDANQQARYGNQGQRGYYNDALTYDESSQV